jgi:hypothetical protein
MALDQAIQVAQATAEELRRRGEEEQAKAIEELVHAVREDLPGTAKAPAPGHVADVLGASGQMLKSWVEEGRVTDFTVGGRLTIPKEIVEEYVRRAGASLDLEDFSDEEAAALVAEGRRKA